MQWPTVDEISAMVPLPDGYRYARVQTSDIGPLIAHLRAWFPGVSVGAGSVYLTEKFYHDDVVLGEDADKNVLALLIWQGDEIAGMGSWERQPDALTIYVRLGAIAPAHRGTKLAVLAMELGEKMGLAMGAGFIYGLATMKLPYMQMALERAGYQLIGFMPGYDREEVSPGVVKRVFEAAYAKRLAHADDFLDPDDKNMTPTTRRLFRAIFHPEQ
jgi:hypothetical protein